MSNEANGAGWDLNGLERRLRTVEALAAAAFPKIGTTTNDNAQAGYVGEFLSATVPVGSAVALSTGVVANVTSLVLTPGDWDVRGAVSYHSASGTTVPADVLQGLSATSATVGPTGSFTYDAIAVAMPEDLTYCAMTSRFSVAVNTTVYLVTKSDFSVSTLSAYGFISARRVR